MAILIKTSDPNGLLDDIKKKIDNHEIDTWSYDADNDFTHDVPQWSRKAWIRPHIDETECLVVFAMVGRKGVVMTKEVYSLFQGRFMEMLLKYYANDVDEMRILLPHRNEFDVKNVDY